MPLNKNDISFLEDLEIKLQVQSQVTLENRGLKFSDLVNCDEFDKFYAIMEKLEQDYSKHTTNTRERLREQRKTDKGYGRPLWYRQYLKDKAQRELEGKSTKGMYKEYEAKAKAKGE